MNRRKLLHAIAAVPPAAAAAAQSGYPPAAAPDEKVRIETTAPDAAATSRTRFLDAARLASLTALCNHIAPADGARPGALQAGAPEFLDFLLAESPADRQLLYSQGLDELESRARSLHGKPFAALGPAQAAGLLAPLEQPWTWAPPGDPLARFLREAKMDILRATVNSKPFADAAGGRRAAALSTYWHPID